MRRRIKGNKQGSEIHVRGYDCTNEVLDPLSDDVSQAFLF